MTAIRDQDRLFLRLAVPLALVAAYAYCWRIDAAKRLDALRGESAALVAAADFDFEMQKARRLLADAQAELERERAVPPPAAKVKGDANATVAGRESEVLRVLREAGLGIVRSEVVDGDARSEFGGKLAATGVRPDPVCRRYTLDGAYPAVRRALDAFAAGEMAVVPERVEMRAAGIGRWTVTLWL